MLENAGSTAARLLIIDTEDSAVELLDASSLKRLAHLPIRAMPHEVAVDHVRRLGYVCISYEDGFYNHYRSASHFLEVVSVGSGRCAASTCPRTGGHTVSRWRRISARP